MFFGKLKTIWRFAEFVAKICEFSFRFPKPNKFFIIQFIISIHSSGDLKLLGREETATTAALTAEGADAPVAVELEPIAEKPALHPSRQPRP